MAKKVLICEFHQETNTFNPIVSELGRFQASRYLEGKAGYDVCKRIATNMTHGIIDAVEQAGAEVIPSVFLSASSGGRVADSVMELAKETVRKCLEENGPVDAVCVDLHGATCTESADDACGEFLEYLRSLVGPVPMTMGCDLHANITQKVLDNADVVCGYQTYPHVDMYQTGFRAGSLCMRLLAGEPVAMAKVHLPVLVPPAGFSNLREPLKGIIEAAKAKVEDGTLLDFSTFLVQPWLDISPIDSTVLAVAADPETAKAQADEIAKMIFDAKDAFYPDLMDVDAIIDMAEANTTGKPVILVDAADSPNGGAVGDSPVVAMRLLERGSKLKAGMFIQDPEAVKAAFRLGVGGTGELTVGACTTPDMPGPLKAVGTVRSLHDGNFIQEGPAGRGNRRCIGLSAVVSFGTVDVLLCTDAMASGDPQLLRHFGIEPSLYDLIVVKANTSFLVPYSKFAGPICYADTPGAGASNLKLFNWKRLPKGMYPFDLPEGYTPEPAKLTR